MVGKGLPDPSMIGLHGAAVEGRQAQGFQRDPLGIEHTKDIVVGDDEQVRRRAKGCVLIGKEARVHVPVGTDQGQINDLLIDLAGKLALRGIWIEIAVFG